MTYLKKYSTEKIIAALKKTKGLVFLAAKIVGCPPNTIYDRAKMVEKVRRTIDDAREEVIDVAEERLFAKAKKGDMAAINFILRTIGKNRGYGDEVRKIVESTSTSTITADVQYQHQIEIDELPIELRASLLAWRRNRELQENGRENREEPKRIEILKNENGNEGSRTNGNGELKK